MNINSNSSPYARSNMSFGISGKSLYKGVKAKLNPPLSFVVPPTTPSVIIIEPPLNRGTRAINLLNEAHDRLMELPKKYNVEGKVQMIIETAQDPDFVDGNWQYQVTVMPHCDITAPDTFWGKRAKKSYISKLPKEIGSTSPYIAYKDPVKKFVDTAEETLQKYIKTHIISESAQPENAKVALEHLQQIMINYQTK